MMRRNDLNFRLLLGAIAFWGAIAAVIFLDPRTSQTVFANGNTPPTLINVNKSVSIDGDGRVTVVYSKGPGSCSNLLDADTFEIQHDLELFCLEGLNTVEVSSFDLYVEIGQSVKLCDGNNSNICSATVVVGGVEADNPPSTVNEPPIVSIISPTEGADFPIYPAIVLVKVAASDSDGIKPPEKGGVRFFLDDGVGVIANQGTIPFNFTFGEVTAGTHTIKVIVTDMQGASSEKSVSFHVGPAGAPAPSSCVVPSFDNSEQTLERAVAPSCPTLSVSSASIGEDDPITITLAPQNDRHYIHKKIYVSQINPKLWVPKELTSCNDSWCTTSDGASHALTLSSSDISSLGGSGIHYVASYDFFWNGSCWFGPDGSSCYIDASNTGGAKWRVNKFTVK